MAKTGNKTEMKGTKGKVKVEGEHANIKAPNIKTAVFKIRGNAPLVIHRFSHKAKLQILEKMEKGSTAKRGLRKAFNKTEAYKESRYISPQGWDGFNAAAIRNAMISACKLVGFPMTKAKMSIFCVADGWDAEEPQIPLVKIIGKPRLQEDMARVPSTGASYVAIRAAFDKWEANVKLRFDADQFTANDIANLLARVGTQVGLCEGRPDSKASAGMGWGTFDVVGAF